MRRTLTVRIDDDLARWLDETARKTGLSQGKIVRGQLERARLARPRQPFMRLAGCLVGPRNLSQRKGFGSR